MCFLIENALLDWFCNVLFTANEIAGIVQKIQKILLYILAVSNLYTLQFP